jgi:hypothetical protein
MIIDKYVIIKYERAVAYLKILVGHTSEEAKKHEPQVGQSVN